MLTNLPFTIDSLHKAYQLGLKPSEVIAESLARIANTNDEGIYLYLASNSELTTAIEKLGPFDLDLKPLWGIPFAVKDNIDVEGMPTTVGCEEYKYIAEQDAFVVSLLKSAGAIVIGKTNLDQFATGLVGMRTPYPAPKNAVNPELVPGGSSSGSAVTVSHNHVCFSLGTDTAGSGRIPAALNNIVGLKPTLGSISATGVVPACRSLDTVSIFALTVEDASQVYAQCRRYDEKDAFSAIYTGAVKKEMPTHFTIGVPNSNSLIIDEPEQKEAYQQALVYWKDKGAKIVEIDFQFFYEVAKLLYEGPWVAERLAALTPFIEQQPEALHPITYKIITSGQQFSACDTFNAFYRLQALRKQTDSILSNIDLMCVPSMPGMVYTKDIELDPITPNSRLGTYTNFVNLLGLCAIAVPGKERSDGLPSSITLIANGHCDALIHTLAADYQTDQSTHLGATKYTITDSTSDLIPTNIQDMLCKDEIAIAAVGAHMKDLPLNYQLIDKGARFLISTKTEAKYSLYCLAGKEPLRPGLIKNNEGNSIELEIWAIQKDKVGDFIDQIPSPLCIGTVTLEDQHQVKGFLCESHGLEGSEDISQFGGWRNFLLSKGY